MKKSATGAALFAGFALAAPLSAYSQAQPQTAPEQQQNRGTAGDRMGTPGMGPQGMGMMGMGMMGAGMRGDNERRGHGLAPALDAGANASADARPIRLWRDGRRNGAPLAGRTLPGAARTAHGDDHLHGDKA